MSFEFFIKDNESVNVHFVSDENMFRTTDALFASNEMVDFMLKELEAMKRRVVEEIPALLSNLLFVSVWRQSLGWGRFMSVCVFVVLALLLDGIGF